MFANSSVGTHWQRRLINRRAKSSAGHQQGMSIVEVMVSMAIGLLVLSFLTVIFVNSSNTRREIDKSAEIYENGRYALLVLGDELNHAGYYGTLTNANGTTDKPCSPTVPDWVDSLAVRGSNHLDTGATLALFSCINGIPLPGRRKSDTDALFVQRAKTCVAGVGDCAGLVANDIYIQVSECGAQYSANPFVLAANSGSPYTLQNKDCAATLAPVRKFIRRIFFVSSDDKLQYVDIGPLGAGTPVPLAENIENMQVEYGVDTDGDSSPDSFVPPGAPADWTQVVGARVWLLARAPQATAGYTHDKSYTMGDLDAPTYAASLNVNKPGFKRHVFTGYFNFVNPQGRKE